MRFETRDPFNEKQKREDAFSCDWDRYAHSEYHRLAQVDITFFSNSFDLIYAIIAHRMEIKNIVYQEEEGAYGMEIIDDAGDEYRESDIDEW